MENAHVEIPTSNSLFRPLGKRAWKHLSCHSLLALSNNKWEVEDRIPFHLSKLPKSDFALISFGWAFNGKTINAKNIMFKYMAKWV
jgi:hypothetical protein